MSLVYTTLIAYSWLTTGNRSLLQQLFMWTAMFMLGVLFVCGRACMDENDPRDRGWLVACGLGFGLLMLATRPVGSIDILNYGGIGWLQYHYGADPYVRVAQSIPHWQNDPMFAPHWAPLPCPYGFLFALIARGIAALSGGDPGTAIVWFKILSLAAFAAMGLLIVKCRNALGVRGDSAALYLWLWNPLILLQGIADGHNDLLMAILIAVAIYFTAIEYYSIVIPALAAAVLIKYAAAIALPFAFVFIMRRAGIGKAVLSVAAGATLALLLAAPYAPHWRAFPLDYTGANVTGTLNSMESIPFYLYEAATKLVPLLKGSLPAASGILKGAFWGGALVTIAVQAVRFAQIRKPSCAHFTSAALLAAMVVILVASSKFQPWYVMMFFPLAMLLDQDSWMRELMVAVSLTQLFAFTALVQVHILNALLMTAAPMVWVGMRHWPTMVSNLAGLWPDEMPGAPSALAS